MTARQRDKEEREKAAREAEQERLVNRERRALKRSADQIGEREARRLKKESGGGEGGTETGGWGTSSGGDGSDGCAFDDKSGAVAPNVVVNGKAFATANLLVAAPSCLRAPVVVNGKERSVQLN